MGHDARSLTVVFMDVCRYSEMDWPEQVACVKILEEVIQQDERCKKSQAIVEGGDAFALGFESVSDAVEFALNVRKKLKIKGAGFDVRMGINTGQVVIRDSINKVKNMYGKGIDYAARLASCCAPGQILAAGHTIENIAGQNAPIRDFVHGKGTYRIKHGDHIEVLNLYSEKEEIGVPVLPLKRKVGDSALVIVVGDRREVPPRTVGDLFHQAPSIDDLCHIIRFDWPEDVRLRGDKVMCWARDSVDTPGIKGANLFIVGSPKVNIAALMINSRSLFRFVLPVDYERDIKAIQDQFSDSRPNDSSFLEWASSNRQMLDAFPESLSIQGIHEPFLKRLLVHGRNESYGVITFAPHPLSHDPSKYAILVAGMDLCATLTITGAFLDELDFSHHPLGGVVKVAKFTARNQPWYDDPHHGRLIGWTTPDYDPATLSACVGPGQQTFIKFLTEGLEMSMTRLQGLLKR